MEEDEDPGKRGKEVSEREGKEGSEVTRGLSERERKLTR